MAVFWITSYTLCENVESEIGEVENFVTCTVTEFLFLQFLLTCHHYLPVLFHKPQISSMLSIGHCLSGVGLFFALAFFCWWFILWVFSKFEPCYMVMLGNDLIKKEIFFTFICVL